jgi:hypothetical protein
MFVNCRESALYKCNNNLVLLATVTIFNEVDDDGQKMMTIAHMVVLIMWAHKQKI